MFDDSEFLSEMRNGVRKAFEIMEREHPEAMIYSISVWTDHAARRSAVSFDTFENSEAKCREGNTRLQEMRKRFGASRVPADMMRNDNPADFAFQRVVIIENKSLVNLGSLDDRGWERLTDLLEQIKQRAIQQAGMLKLHPDAEIGISIRKDWYGNVVKIVRET